jgi:hypothetical protein
VSADASNRAFFERKFSGYWAAFTALHCGRLPADRAHAASSAS